MSESLLPVITLLIGLLIPALGKAGKYLADWKREDAKRREQRREAALARRREALEALLKAYETFTLSAFYQDPTGGEEALTKMQTCAVRSRDAVVMDAVEAFIASEGKEGKDDYALRRALKSALNRLEEW